MARFAGEINVPTRHAHITKDTPIKHVPSDFLAFSPNIYLMNGAPWHTGAYYECWRYKSFGDYLPRVSKNWKSNGERPQQTSVRRLVANIFYCVEETEHLLGKRIFVHVNTRCPQGCINPRHMTFSDHPYMRKT